MKPYTVTLLTGKERIDLNALPVAKITQYPLEKRDYKPYAQVVLGVDDLGLHARLVSFETAPEEESTISMVLYPFPENPQTALHLVVYPSTVGFGTEGPEPRSFAFDAKAYNGEDLQGSYWGGEVLIPRAPLEKIGRLVTLEDKILLGNFYKQSKGERPHKGSFWPVVDPHDDSYSKEDMAPFILTNF